MRHLLVFLVFAFAFTGLVLADTETFTINTDANGNGSDQDTIPFGTVTISSFSVQFSGSAPIATVRAELNNKDGSTVIAEETNVPSGQSYTVNKSANKGFVLKIIGGPANSTVQFTIDYAWGTRESSRDKETFDVATDANGYGKDGDSVPFGKITINWCIATFTGAPITVKAVMDGNATEFTNISSGQKVNIGLSAKKNLLLEVYGGPANSTVRIEMDYTWGAKDSRDSETFAIETDENGNGEDGDDIPFGKFTLQNFSATESFAGVKVYLDSKVLFESPVNAGQTYTVNKSCRKNLKLKAEGGPAHKKVNITVQYKWGFRNTEEVSGRDKDTFTLNTDNNGDATTTDSVPFGTVTVNQFQSASSFAQVQIVLDNKVVFDGAVDANNPYMVNASAKKDIKIIGKGGPAGQSVTVTFDYNWGASDMFSKKKVNNWKFVKTTDADGSIREKTEIELKNDKLKLLGFKSGENFKEFALFIDGRRVFPCHCSHQKGVKANKFYRLKLHGKLKNGRHTFGISAQGGEAGKEVQFAIYYK